MNPIRPPRAPVALDHEAHDNLRFIRETMQRSHAFTAVPGWGGLAMGVTALPAAWLAHRAATPDRWLLTWLIEANLAGLIGLAALIAKSRASGQALGGGAARGFALGFTPPLAAGALLTAVFRLQGWTAHLPGVWLLLYGTGVITGGSHSIRLVPILGALFVALAVVAFAAPAPLGDLWMALGFGGLQILFGFIIGRRHGG